MRTAANGEAENVPTEGNAGGKAQKEEPLEELQNALLGVGGETMIEELLRRHVITRLSDEGLVIELFETADARLFDDTNEPTELLTLILETIVPVIRLVENDVAVQAHTKSFPIVVRENNAWDRTTIRADRLRLALEDASWPGDRIKRLTGFADRSPITENPTDPRNNRIEIIVLR